MTDPLKKSRRDFLTVASVGGAMAAFSALSLGDAQAAVAAGRSEKRLQAAFSNGGLQSSWCSQGKAAAEYWGKLFNVDVTWFDGQLDAAKQRAAIQDMASRKWDFVAIQAAEVDALTDPVQKIIDSGTPVIAMETQIASTDKVHLYSLIGADNEDMGAAVTLALATKLGGAGKIIMTQGPLGHGAVQGRAKGFETIVKQYPGIEVLDTKPADWDSAKVVRLWEGYLAKYPRIDAAFFHSDDMALAAYSVMKAKGRTSILIASIDAMPPAIEAVFDGRMFATVRNPAGLVHGGAIIAGVAAVTGVSIPQRIYTPIQVVTLEKAPGMLWLQDQYLS